MRLSSTLSSHILKNSSDEDSATSLGRLFLWWIFLTVKISFLYWDETSASATSSHCPLSFPSGSLWRETLCHICSRHLSTGTLWWGFPWAVSSPRRIDLTPSVFPHTADSPAHWPSFGPSPVCMHPSQTVGTKTGHSTCPGFGQDRVKINTSICCLCRVKINPVLAKPKTVPQVWPEKRWVEWGDHVSISVGNAPADAAQDSICLCCSNVLLTRVQLVAHQDPQVSFSNPAPQPHRS